MFSFITSYSWCLFTEMETVKTACTHQWPGDPDHAHLVQAAFWGSFLVFFNNILSGDAPCANFQKIFCFRKAAQNFTKHDAQLLSNDKNTPYTLLWPAHYLL